MNLDLSRQRLAAGTRIGDHLIVRGVLGEGGTAVVYEALHTRLGASVALKVVDVSDEYMEGAHARLLREAQVCASIEDPHVPRIYDVGELPDGTPFVVMERVSGRTLESVLAEGALPLDIAVHVADDLLQAVEAIERAGIVHRDIKPPNIILQPGSEGTLRVRLMDFGVSKTIGTGDRESSMHQNPALTQQGAIVGTPHYMAPEQIVGPSVDTRTDLYAVGVVAYEMMGGRTPFEGQTTGDVVAAVLHTRPLPLRKLRPVHPALEAWVERAMAPRRTDRFPTARAMRDALHEAWNEQLAYVAAAGRRRWAKRARRVGAMGLVVVGIALPLPAGYDVSALTALLHKTPAPTSEVATPAPSVATAAAKDVGSAMGAVADTHEQPTLPAVPAAPAWDMHSDTQGVSLTDPAAEDDLPTGASLPQAEPLRDEDAEQQLQLMAPQGAADEPVVTPRKRAGAATGVRRQTAPRAAAYAPRAEPAPRGGVLLNEYLQQLDQHLAPPAPAASAPAAASETGRSAGQPAPNPFGTALPDNPYGHDGSSP